MTYRIRVFDPPPPKLRIVPANPDPAQFPLIPYACDVAPARCLICHKHLCCPTYREALYGDA